MIGTLVSIAKKIREKPKYLESPAHREGMITLLGAMEPTLTDSLKLNPADPTLGPYLELIIALLK